MIIITGANGTLGREIVEQVLLRASPQQVGVSVRDPAKSASLGELGVRVRLGNFADPDTLSSAFEGASQVLIISSNTFGGDAVEQHRNAIDAAVKAGAQRILYTSHMGASPDSLFAPMRDHFATERLLQECGVPFTALRNGFYATTPTYFLGSATETGSLAVPEDGPVSWTTHSDLAEATAITLTEEGRLDGLTPPLTATEALTFSDIAAVLSEISGRQVTRSVISDEQFKAALISHGAPEVQASFSLTIFAAARAGNFAAVDPTLGQLLGRKCFRSLTLGFGRGKARRELVRD